MKIAGNFPARVGVKLGGRLRPDRLAIGGIISAADRVSTECPNVVPQIADFPKFTSADVPARAGAGSNFPNSKRTAASIAAANIVKRSIQGSDRAASEHAARADWDGDWLSASSSTRSRADFDPGLYFEQQRLGA